MENADRYYKHSGIFSISGILSTLSVGIVAALVCGAAYGFLCGLIPIIYLVFIIAMVAGFCVGFVTGAISKLFKIRNSGVAMVMGAVAGLFAVYASWVVWIWYQSDFVYLHFSPVTIFNVMSNVAEDGLWEIFGWTPTGWALWLIWFVELGLIVVISVGTALTYIDDRIFCESCNHWLDKPTSFGPLTPIEDEDIESFISKLEQKDYVVLSEMKKLPEDELRFATIDVRLCEECRDKAYMSVINTTITINNKNERDTDTKKIITNLIVPTEIKETLKLLKEETAETEETTEADEQKTTEE